MGGARVEAMIDEFNKTNDKNITVEFNFISANYPEIAPKFSLTSQQVRASALFRSDMPISTTLPTTSP